MVRPGKCPGKNPKSDDDTDDEDNRIDRHLPMLPLCPCFWVGAFRGDAASALIRVNEESRQSWPVRRHLPFGQPRCRAWGAIFVIAIPPDGSYVPPASAIRTGQCARKFRPRSTRS